jgi:hypothetical protein
MDVRISEDKTGRTLVGERVEFLDEHLASFRRVASVPSSSPLSLDPYISQCPAVTFPVLLLSMRFAGLVSRDATGGSRLLGLKMDLSERDVM